MDEETRAEVLKAIEKYEALGEFDRHVDPIDWSIALPVTADFPYIPRGFLKIKYAFLRIFVSAFQRKVNRETLRTEFSGVEHFKGIRAAILTCNHVDKFDSLAVKAAAKGHRVYVVGAEFNNMKGSFGEKMRAAGMLPLSHEMGAMKAFHRAVGHYLKTGSYVLIYPEQAMWWHYEKPRPYKDGAFTLAVRYNVPIIPCFITFRHSGEYDENGIEKKYFTVNVMEAIYPDPTKKRHDAVAALKEENYRAAVAKYEEIYGKPLKYGAESKV